MSDFKIRIEWRHLAIAAAALLLAAAYLFGATGIKTLGFWLLLYIIPAYLILNKQGLDELESFVISIFATAGTISALVFFLNFIVPSVRLSAIIIFALEIAAAYLVYKKVK